MWLWGPALYLWCGVPVVNAAEFSGRFAGPFQGQPSVAELQQSGASVSGRYEVAGYPYEMQLQVSGRNGEGVLIDRATNGSIPLQVQLQDQGLVLFLDVNSPDGQWLQVALERAGSGAGTATPPSPTNETPAAGNAAQMPGGMLDPVLVGSWSQSTSYTSGDFTAASSNAVTLMPDGRVVDGGSRVIGGGGMGGFDSGADGGGGVSGYWSTQGQVLYFNQGAGWQPLGRYYVEGGSCLLTAPDGSREVWKRM